VGPDHDQIDVLFLRKMHDLPLGRMRAEADLLHDFSLPRYFTMPTSQARALFPVHRRIHVLGRDELVGSVDCEAVHQFPRPWEPEVTVVEQLGEDTVTCSGCLENGSPNQ
jgi:hypothetical protein